MACAEGLKESRINEPSSIEEALASELAFASELAEEWKASANAKSITNGELHMGSCRIAANQLDASGYSKKSMTRMIKLSRFKHA